MPRNLVICCDGTNNEFGPENTNVVRLVQSLVRNPEQQLIYYDPGVGTLPEPGRMSRLGQRLSEFAGLAFGVGLGDKIAGAYQYLMQTWQPGDRVYLFGFSRGAYGVRALAAMLHLYGLLPAGNHNLLPYLMRQFMASKRQLDRDQAAYWKFCNEFQRTFAREVPGQADRRFRVHLLGAWDTVSSVGWVWDPVALPFSARNESIAIVRHAVAIDERRAFFRQNTFANAVPGQDMQELWFPGVHADIGGGYRREQGALWRVAFEWMLDEARHAGLLVDEPALQRVLSGTPADRAWAEPINRSLKGWWWPAEVFPKLRWQAAWRRRLPHLNLARPRRIDESACLHPSVQWRRESPDLAYDPPNLPAMRPPNPPSNPQPNVTPTMSPDSPSA